MTCLRCVLSHDGYGCTLGADHDGDTHEGADGHTWTTNESWGCEEADDQQPTHAPLSEVDL